jgi:hypothetical protein
MKMINEYRELYHTPFLSVANVNRDSNLPNIILKCVYVWHAGFKVFVQCK